MSLIQDPSVRMLQHKYPDHLSSAKLEALALKARTPREICRMRLTTYSQVVCGITSGPIVGTRPPGWLADGGIQPLAARHPPGDADDHAADHEQGQRCQHVDFRTHTQSNLGENHHGQCAAAR